MYFKKRKYTTYLYIVSALLFAGNVYSQETSAEFITSVKPAKLSSGEQARDGIKNIFFHEQKLYITNIWSGLQIVDVSDVNQPKEVGVFTTETRSHNCYVVDGKAYLSSELKGITILDVSVPSAIKQVGNVKTSGDALFVVADSQYIYVAEATFGVKIYDVSDPANPKITGTFDTQGFAWGLFLDGKTLYIADKGKGIVILDVKDPANPVKIGQSGAMKYAKSIQVENKIAYVSNGADGLWIFDVSNLAFPKVISKIVTDGYVYHAFKAGNSAFLSNETGKKMDIINVTNPAKPVKEGEYITDSKVYTTWKNDVYVYLAADTKTIIVRHNHPPFIAEIEDISVDENVPLIFTAEATDQDGDEIYFTIDNLPDSAQMDLTTGVFNWTPNYDQSGLYPDIKITVIEKTQSALSGSTTFNITVNHVNRAPSLPDVADNSVNENAQITFTLEPGSDPDIEDKGKLIYKAENMPEGATFDPVTRVFTWTPSYEQSGIYTVDFIVEDPPGLIMRDGATLTVNHIDRKPDLVEVEDATVAENELITITLKGTDPDQEDQDKLSYRAENLPQGALFDATNAVFTWTPTYDQSGEYKNILFIFTAGKLSDSTSVDIMVSHVNRPPLMDAIAMQTVNENDTLQFVVTGSDPDIEDAGKYTFTAQYLPEGATFDAATQTFSWVPTFEQSGEYAGVAFTITDPSGLNDSKDVTITVNHVNRTPALAEMAPQTVDENVMLTFELLGSDPDAEDQGKLVYTADGLPEGAALQNNKFEWLPTYDQSGDYTVNFTVTDGLISVSRAVAIKVNHINRAPELAEINGQTVNENVLLQFTVKGSDPDKEDAGKFILSTKNLPLGALFDAATGAFTWTPTFEQSGEYTVTFVNTDPQGLFIEKNVKITVVHVNRTPEFPLQTAQIVDENAPLTFTLLPATDPDAEDAQKITYSAANLPERAAFDVATQTLTWTPSFEQSGKYTITFTATDGEFSVEQPLEITVNHVNRAPQLQTIAAQSVDENTPLTIAVEATDPDQEDAGKIVTTVANLPQGAGFEASSNIISWTPTFEQSGTYPGISVTVTDVAGLTAQQSFDITVNHVNRSPVINPVNAVTVNENVPVAFSVSGSDPDQEDQNKLVISMSNAPAGASFDGSGFSWTPGFDQAGVYTIPFTISDGTATASTDASVTVTNVNRAPQVNDIIAPAFKEGESGSFTISASDPDTEDNLQFTMENAPDGASLSGPDFSWTPSFEQAGNYTVSFTVSDGNLTATTNASLTVENVNRDPEIDGPSSADVEAGSSLSLSYSASDADNDNLSFRLDGAPSGMSINGSGQISWNPDDGQVGSHSVSVVVSDGTAEDTLNLNVTVTAIPQPEPVPADSTQNQ